MDRLLQLINTYKLDMQEIFDIIDNSKDNNIIEILTNELDNIYG